VNTDMIVASLQTAVELAPLGDNYTLQLEAEEMQR